MAVESSNIWNTIRLWQKVLVKPSENSMCLTLSGSNWRNTIEINMTASKVQPRPNSFLSASTAAPQNGALASYGNANHLQRSTKRCLFGKPDSAETKRLYDESVQQDRNRFISRYGFDTVTGQPVGNSSISSYPSSSSSSALRRSPTREYSGRPNEATNNRRAVQRWFRKVLSGASSRNLWKICRPNVTTTFVTTFPARSLPQHSTKFKLQNKPFDLLQLASRAAILNQ